MEGGENHLSNSAKIKPMNTPVNISQAHTASALRAPAFISSTKTTTIKG